MNLRIARKIIKTVGTLDAMRYSAFQISKAFARYEKTRTAKEANRFWADLARNGYGYIIDDDPTPDPSEAR